MAIPSSVTYFCLMRMSRLKEGDMVGGKINKLLHLCTFGFLVVD